jgi:hypothetical protein
MGLIVDNGYQAAFSMRAMGRLVSKERGTLVKPLKIICWDEVVRPSVADAYMGGMVMEDASLAPKITDRFGDVSVSDKLIAVNEDFFAGYVFEQSKRAQEVADKLGIDISDPSVTLSINEDGKLVAHHGELTICLVAESDIRRDIESYLASKDSK